MVVYQQAQPLARECVGGLLRVIAVVVHGHQLFQRRLRECQDLLEQLFLVGEMPVDWPARAAGLLGDKTQCGAAVTALPEKFQRRVDQALACPGRILFCSSHAQFWVGKAVSLMRRR